MSAAPHRASALAHEVVRGAIDPVAVVDAALERIARHAALNAVVSVVPGHARREALRVRRERRGPLAGVPVLVKDTICTRPGRTTCCSRMLAGWRAPYEATAVTRLRAAGAVIVGKTTCDEFGLGSSTETAWQGPARHPLDPERVPGGSSGGSAAAVAAGLVPLALGSDTGGSVRQPAAFCGIVGFKPAWGSVPRRGLVAFASSFDQIGPLAGDAADAELAWRVMAGRDPLDATSAEPAAGAGTMPARAGVPEARGHATALDEALDRARAVLADAGVQVGAARLPDPDRCLFAYLALSAAELSSNLARFDGVRYGLRAAERDGLEAMYRASRGRGLGTEVRRRILLGTWVLAGPPDRSVHARARALRARIAREVMRELGRHDVLVLPTTDGPAFRIGERTGDPLAMYRSDRHTVLASLCGLPAISLPAPVRADGLPVGVQLVTAPRREPQLFAAARALERAGFRAEPAP